MQNKIKATLLDYFELGGSTSSVRIAKAMSERDEPLAFVTVENCVMVSGATVNPETTPDEQQKSGAVIEAELIKAARRQGATRLLIIVPEGCTPAPDEDWTELRVYSRELRPAPSVKTFVN
jgi:hypothetical protein